MDSQKHTNSSFPWWIPSHPIFKTGRTSELQINLKFMFCFFFWLWENMQIVERYWTEPNPSSLWALSPRGTYLLWILLTIHIHNNKINPDDLSPVVSNCFSMISCSNLRSTYFKMPMLAKRKEGRCPACLTLFSLFEVVQSTWQDWIVRYFPVLQVI